MIYRANWAGRQSDPLQTFYTVRVLTRMIRDVEVC